MMIEATARAHGLPASGTGHWIFPKTNLGIPGSCAQPASDLFSQALLNLATLAGIPPCTKGTFLMGLRGTLEADADNLGGPVGKLAEKLKAPPADPNGVTTFGVPYPANVTGPIGAAGLNLPAGYAESVSVGAIGLLAALATHLQCSGEKIVLAGYSQGAQAIRIALGLLPPDLRAKINHVVLFADPTVPPGGMPEKDLKAGVPTETLCHAGDPLCTGDPQHALDCVTFQKQCPRFGYEKEAADAAEVVKRALTKSR